MIRVKFPSTHRFAGYGIQTNAKSVDELNRMNTRIVSFKDKKSSFILLERPSYYMNGGFISIYDIIKEVKQL